MKNFVIVLLVSIFFTGTTGCLKDNDSVTCTNKTPASESAAIEAYAATNGYPVIAHSSGVYYQVVNSGSGPGPSASSKVFVSYTGRLIANNTIFDQQSNHLNTGWPLDLLIQGWQIGLPMIGEGGTIRLIIPSSLAYGCRGYGTVPGDSILFFEIELVDIQ